MVDSHVGIWVNIQNIQRKLDVQGRSREIKGTLNRQFLGSD